MHHALSDADRSALVTLMLREDLSGAVALCERLTARGVPAESLYLHLLAPAARALHRLWEDDEVNFVQVTVAVSVLERLMHRMGPPDTALGEGDARRRHEIMLVPVPGSQHTLGLQMVAAFFRAAGWGVWCAPALRLGDLQHQVAQRWFDVVGLSIGAESQVATLAAAVRGIRQHAKNRQVRILIGGPALTLHSDIAERVQADAGAIDVLQALIVAERLVGRQVRHVA